MTTKAALLLSRCGLQATLKLAVLPLSKARVLAKQLLWIECYQHTLH